MAGSLHLADRVVLLGAEVDRLGGLLIEVEQGARGLPGERETTVVRDRLEASVGNAFGPMREELRILGAEHLAGRKPIGELWGQVEDIADRLQNRAADLLPAVEGALARATGLDRGMCALAEELLAPLARWCGAVERTVVPAPTEHTKSGMWVIGLPLAADGIWSLPIAAHEFGHVVMGDLKDEYGRRLAENLVNGSWRDAPSLPAGAANLPGPLPYAKGAELFADIFAAYCVGPAYAAALMARCVPVDAWKSRGDHPSHAARLRAVFTVCEGTSLRWISEWLRTDWENLLAASGPNPTPPTVVAAVDAFTCKAIVAMNSTASLAKFDDNDRVLAVGELLRTGRAPAIDAELRIVLNAAWAERRRNGALLPRIQTAIDRWMTARVPSSGGHP